MLVTPLLPQRRRQRDAQSGPDDDADDGAEQRDDHRLGADHRPDLAALHPDRAEQADLARALEHRQHQRVDDSDQRDEHGQREQHVHEPELLVDLVLL